MTYGTIKCPNCGAPIPVNSEACQYCGEALPKAAPPPQQATPSIMLNFNQDAFEQAAVAGARSFLWAFIAIPIVLVVVGIIFFAAVLPALSRSGSSGLGVNLNSGNSQLLSKKCENCSLPNTTANNADLSGGKFRGISLVNGSFRGSNFKNADLSRADLSNSKMSNADLSGADLTGAKLSNVDLSNAN
ncbi:MAG: pentapeptide repeat-containing protein, partial [Candidatus Dormibacteraeota bacterium]|nr:pentapeptide repeat-containing protein [Candidatus Dormibacteraeota bacterium]